MDICTFDDNYLNALLEKFSKEANKTTAFLSNFNIDFLNFDTSDYKNTFLDDLASNSPLPDIFIPTWVRKNIKTVIDNVFCNTPNPVVKTAIFGNISSSISNHLPRFFILPDIFLILYQLNITLYPMTGKTWTKEIFSWGFWKDKLKSNSPIKPKQY